MSKECLVSRSGYLMKLFWGAFRLFHRLLKESKKSETKAKNRMKEISKFTE